MYSFILYLQDLFNLLSIFCGNNDSSKNTKSSSNHHTLTTSSFLKNLADSIDVSV
jgi:hypothetical protein